MDSCTAFLNFSYPGYFSMVNFVLVSVFERKGRLVLVLLFVKLHLQEFDLLLEVFFFFGFFELVVIGGAGAVEVATEVLCDEVDYELTF